MVYLDSSLISSLYLKDLNALEAHRLVTATVEPLLGTPLCEFETLNAFSLGRFRKEFSETETDQLRKNFEDDLAAGFYLRRMLPDSAFGRAKALAQTLTPAHGVRSADLLHIAAAVELGAKSFYTFDRRQHTAAQAASLQVNALP
jgi:predicted nucleic acid-binding protein